MILFYYQPITQIIYGKIISCIIMLLLGIIKNSILVAWKFFSKNGCSFWTVWRFKLQIWNGKLGSCCLFLVINENKSNTCVISNVPKRGIWHCIRILDIKLHMKMIYYKPKEGLAGPALQFSNTSWWWQENARKNCGPFQTPAQTSRRTTLQSWQRNPICICTIWKRQATPHRD